MGIEPGAMEGLEMMTQFSGIYNNMKVFITGITGFKGSWLALWLTKLGAQVTGYALSPPTDPNHFDLIDMDIAMIYGDIRNDEELIKAVVSSRPEIVFHLAAQPLVRYSYSNPKETFETNVIGTLNLFEACRKADGIKAIVNITTDKCYENREWIWPYRENEPMGGFDPYSASKGCSELLTACYRNSFFDINKYGKDHNVLVASCRAGNVIGGGDWAEDRLIPDIVRAAARGVPVEIRSPRAIRPWQHVLEPLAGYLLLGEKLLRGKTEFGEPWNFGPDEQDAMEVESIVKILQQNWSKINYKAHPEESGPHEAHMLRLDSSKAKAKLGWAPVWNLEKAARFTSAWYRCYYEDGKPCSHEQLNAYTADALLKKAEWTLP